MLERVGGVLRPGCCAALRSIEIVEEGILVVSGVRYADFPGTLVTFFRFMKLHPYVQTLVSGSPEVVALSVFLVYASGVVAFLPQVFQSTIALNPVLSFGECHGLACSVNVSS